MMEECMRKLALWHTRTFEPVMTHEELEPIMSTMGFVGFPPHHATTGGFKDYVFLSCPTTDHQPRTKLPYPHMDGLHINTYQAFIDALAFFLDVSNLFHVRGMPLQQVKDKKKNRNGAAWKRMRVCVYRDGTLENSNRHGLSKMEDAETQVLIHKNALPHCTLLPLKDIIATI